MLCAVLELSVVLNLIYHVALPAEINFFFRFSITLRWCDVQYTLPTCDEVINLTVYLSICMGGVIRKRKQVLLLPFIIHITALHPPVGPCCC